MTVGSDVAALSDTDNVDVGVRRLRQHYQAPGSAADIEYAMTRTHFGLTEKFPSRVVEAEQRRDRIVERQQPIDAHSREECAFRF